MITKKIPWSWSRLSCFEECPKKFQHMNILKDVPFVTSEAMERGKRIHKALEDAVKLGSPLPDTLAHMSPVVASILALPGAKLITEEQIAFDETMCRTEYFAKDVWLRVIMDLSIITPAARTATIFDWKSGRFRPEYSDQLALSAMAGFALWPGVNTITVAYVWVDHKKKTEAVFYRDQYEHLLRKFGDRSEMIQLANEVGVWNAVANPHCKWCPLTQAQCTHKRN